MKSCRTIIWQNNYIPVPWSFSEELWNNNPSFARSEEDPGRLLFRRSLVVHVYVESLKYTKAQILHVPWSFFWVRYHRYVGRYHTVGSYAKYILPLSRKIKPLRPFFLGPQNKTAMPDNSYVCKLRSFQRARHRFACGGLRSCVLCRFARLVVGCDWPTMISDYNRPPEQWQANDIWWYWWQTRAKTSSQHRQTLYRIEALN